MSTRTETHLSEKAMLRWQAGDGSEAERAHMAACPDCQERARPVMEAVSWFSAAAREWAEEKALTREHWRASEAGPEWRGANAAPRWRRMAAGWAVACAMLLMLLLVGLPRWQAHQAVAQAEARQRQLQQELAQDNALLDEVDRDVSQLVPDAMEPLSRTKGRAPNASGAGATARQ